MKKAYNFYESLFVVNTTQGDEAVAAVVDRFTGLIADNAQIIDVAKWGKRRLAYPINDLNEGYYVVVTFKSQPGFITELERLLNINEMILRSMTIRLPYDAEAKFKARLQIRLSMKRRPTPQMTRLKPRRAKVQKLPETPKLLQMKSKPSAGQRLPCSVCLRIQLNGRLWRHWGILWHTLISTRLF